MSAVLGHWVSVWCESLKYNFVDWLLYAAGPKSALN
jgi:hypothetical protein